MDHPNNIRDFDALKTEKCNEENVSTSTSTEQVCCLSNKIDENIE